MHARRTYMPPGLVDSHKTGTGSIATSGGVAETAPFSRRPPTSKHGQKPATLSGRIAAFESAAQSTPIARKQPVQKDRVAKHCARKVLENHRQLASPEPLATEVCARRFLCNHRESVADKKDDAVAVALQPVSSPTSVLAKLSTPLDTLKEDIARTASPRDGTWIATCTPRENDGGSDNDICEEDDCGEVRRVAWNDPLVGSTHMVAQTVDGSHFKIT